MRDLLNYNLFGNSVESYLFLVIIILVAGVLHFIAKKIIDQKISFEKPFIKMINRGLTAPAIWFSAFYIIFKNLELSESFYDVINILYIIIITWFTTRFIVVLFSYTADQYLKRSKSEEDQRRIRPLLSFFKILIWIFGFLYLLHYLGVDVTTAVAGLGIGGIAIALAAQTILGDLFSYFVINFDRPFEIGDFLIFDDKLGVVEKIGIKSTKIRALSGEMLVVSNSNLTNARIHNYKRMERRRVVFNFGVVYQTESEKLELIPKLVEEFIKENEMTEFDRCHFKAFGNFSLDFETVYFIKTNDFKIYMDIQQEINLKIFKEFENRNIDFAYPTQTIHLDRSIDNT
jgi:small-conductance mechanosensitive channel